jgi:type II secretory pathway pseudopilin PulG
MRVRNARPENVPRLAMIQLEVIASLGLTIVLAALITVSVVQYARVRRETDTRRLLQLAAAAEIDRIRAGVHPLPSGAPGSPSLAENPGEIVVRATATPGTGLWQGLTRVRVVASKRMSGSRTMVVELAAFVPGGGPS